MEGILKLTAFESTTERPAARPPETHLWRHEGLRRVETVRLWPEPDVAVPGLAYTWRGLERTDAVAERWPPEAGAWDAIPTAHPAFYTPPSTSRRRALLWVDGDGKDAAPARPALRATLAELLPAAWLVLAIDVRGVGETAPRETGRANARIMGTEAFLTYESFVAGRPLFGMRLRDAVCAVDYLLDRPDVATESGVTLVGWGAGGLLALHLAALDGRIAALATVDTLASYRSLVAHEHYAHHVSSFIPGVVANLDSPDGYEVDDVVALVLPRPLLCLRPVDQLHAPLTAETDEEVANALLDWLHNLNNDTV